jgi:hypothetical protein
MDRQAPLDRELLDWADLDEGVEVGLLVVPPELGRTEDGKAVFDQGAQGVGYVIVRIDELADGLGLQHQSGAYSVVRPVTDATAAALADWDDGVFT